jgi:hypothetical protein
MFRLIHRQYVSLRHQKLLPCPRRLTRNIKRIEWPELALNFILVVTLFTFLAVLW